MKYPIHFFYLEAVRSSDFHVVDNTFHISSGVKGMHIKFKQIQYLFSIFDHCTDEYIFIFDFKKDHYLISQRALEVFRLDKADFYHASEALRDVIYAEDFALVQRDLQELKEGQKKTHNIEYRWLNKENAPVWISCRGEVVQDEDGSPRYLFGRIADLGVRNKIDNVSGLYNENILKKEYLKYVKKENISGYMMLIGIDNYKDINEKYGHTFGDSILVNLAAIIKGCIRQTDYIYRMEGDNIAIWNKSGGSIEDAKDLYQRIRMQLEASISEHGFKMFHTISAGAATYDTQLVSYEILIDRLSFSLHQAKRKGKNIFVSYQKEEYEEYMRRLDIQECLRRDIENHFLGFELYYQPIIRAEDSKIHGAEALIRWNSSKYGFMSPGEFIPMLEETSLIIPLGRWIIKTAFRQCTQWKKKYPDFQMNINLSFVQLQRSNIVYDIMECMKEEMMDSANVIFELTESGEIETSQVTQNVLKRFKEHSIRLAIDDFGTGYSNLRYVKENTFDVIKIDRLFIQNILNSEYDYILVKHVTELAHGMNLKVCYEGVETKEQLEAVKQLHPDYIQGFYYGRPIEKNTFEEQWMSS